MDVRPGKLTIPENYRPVINDVDSLSVSWISKIAPCPPQIREMFGEFIGSPPFPVTTANEAQSKGFVRSPLITGDLSQCLQLIASELRSCSTRPEFVLEAREFTDPNDASSMQYVGWSKPALKDCR